MTEPLVALTGATGFLGRHVLEALAGQDVRIRLLVRRPIELPPHLQNKTELILGDLASHDAIDRLVDGASVVIHAAGLTKALSKREFMATNRDGAERIAAATMQLSPGAHFILVSSLAAREPQLSAYAASKRAGEEAARHVFSGGRLTILRPPAIYGPGDRELLPVFRLAAMPLIPLLGRSTSRMALAHATDVAATIVTIASNPSYSQTETNLYSLGGALPSGHNWREILAAAASAQGVAPRFFELPQSLAATILKAAGIVSGALAYLTGKPRVFTLGKANEMLHPDWSVGENELPQGIFCGHPTPLREGFESTIFWYRDAGWLPEKDMHVNQGRR